MNKVHLTSLQIGTLCFFLINSFIVTIGYNYITNISNTDAILDILLGGGGIILYLIVILWLKKNNVNKNLIDFINDFHFFKWIIYPIIIMIILITIIYSLNIITTFIKYYILKEVDDLIIMTTFIATILYLVKNGLSTITKVSEVMFYFYLMLLLLGFIGLFNMLDFNNIKPLFSSSLSNHLHSSFIYFISSILPLSLLLMIPEETVKSNKKERSLPIYLTILAIILLFFQLILILSVLGIHLANIYQNPDMMIYKKISFLNLLDRVETILAFNYILNGFFLLVMCVFTLKIIVSNFIKTKKEHINITLLGIIVLFLASSLEITKAQYLLVNLISFFVFILILIKSIIDKYIRLKSNYS